MKRLHGTVCAMITPMLENGRVDVAGVRSLSSMLIEGGIHCLYPNGTNGESLLLSPEERKEIAETIQKENRGRSTLYIQCGAMRPEEGYAHVLHAQAIGADGAGLMTPTFFPVDEAAMTRYYADILAQIPEFPLYIYNIACRTGNDVSPRMVGQLMDRYENLLGLKFSAPDLMRVQAYVRCAERRASVLIGCDALALACLMCGGDGYVSGPCAAFPETFAGIYDAWRAGDFAQAQALQERVLELQKRMTGIPEIPAIKYLLWKKGVIATPVCRPPFRSLDQTERVQLDELLAYAHR